MYLQGSHYFSFKVDNMMEKEAACNLVLKAISGLHFLTKYLLLQK